MAAAAVPDHRYRLRRSSQESPGNRPAERRQGTIRVNDLVEPGLENLPAVPSLPRLHRNTLRFASRKRKESPSIPPINLQENQCTSQ
jgi:hypothetical protein